MYGLIDFINLWSKIEKYRTDVNVSLHLGRYKEEKFITHYFVEKIKWNQLN